MPLWSSQSGQQNLIKLMGCPARITRVVNDGKMLQKRPKAALLIKNRKGKVHGGAPSQTATLNHTKINLLITVNLSSKP